MARRLHGLAGIKEDALEVVITGTTVVVGASVAHKVAGFVNEIGLEKADDGSIPPMKKDGVTKNEASLPSWVGPVVPVAVGVGIMWASDKYKLSGKARQAALGVAVGMGAYGIAKTVLAVLPKKKSGEEDKIGDTLAKYSPFAGLSGVDTYDSGLLAGLGEIDASVARYMMHGYPTQIQTLQGAPILVQPANAGMIGSPTVAQQLAGAPLSATLM